ncbi:MAG TPA: sensor histidine kinase [Bryobacteraceae bacterium]|jgi:signal transduction histidine kinase|nr:sensor histidine kinase [Bryobacteraceae bacterium]
MSSKGSSTEVLRQGTLRFSIESRILRELGERLVKQPEVALLELVKNAYDADSKTCEIVHQSPGQISVTDDGQGMTLSEFEQGWMRIGTSAKEGSPQSRLFKRTITGEKGIGRFAVRFLGKALHLESTAFDGEKGIQTLLTADFNWPEFDRNEDLGKIEVPYRLTRAKDGAANGTRLLIAPLRENALVIDLDAVRTASIGVVTPYQSLLKPRSSGSRTQRDNAEQDPGFSLKIFPARTDAEDSDVAATILDGAVLRAVVNLEGDRLHLAVYRRNSNTATIKILDRFKNVIGPVYADIRFFPQRKGTYTELPVDGRKAKKWVKEHSGVAVFDRTFRVYPYGTEDDDWLYLSVDTAKRERDPRSSIAKKHFPMDEPTYRSTQANYMLRLPYPQQLVGVVQVEGLRTRNHLDSDDGLIASADREGFVDNKAFGQLRDLIRGVVEAIASADRELQEEIEREEQDATLRQLREETQEAIREIQANPDIARGEKTRIVARLAHTQLLAEKHEERSRQHEAALEVMSLLGIVAGFMTHEFGTALKELEKAHERLTKLVPRDTTIKEATEAIGSHIALLNEFVTYSQGYIRGASSRPENSYPARPRVQQVKRVFGKYATDRGINVDIEIEKDLVAPLVPVSLYNGVALNLFTNALKAVTAKAGKGERRIVFRAWNEQKRHFLEVSDTGIGVPVALRNRVFDPLFTTTASNNSPSATSIPDPLGSGMGLGLTLVKRGVESYGGRVDMVDPPAGFSTCVRVRLPLEGEA